MQTELPTIYNLTVDIGTSQGLEISNVSAEMLEIESRPG
jgi:hypothetical protein